MSGMRRAIGAVALLCVLAVAACTPGPPEPAPPMTPTPTPTVSRSPSETPQERQERLDYAAAEKSYRTFRAEYNRVLRAGGAREPTKVIKTTAGGDYLATFTKVMRGYQELQSRDVGREKVMYVRGGGYQQRSLVLKVCEDSREVRTLRRSGKDGRGEVRTATIEVRNTGNAWKLWSGSGRLVDSCN